MKNISNRLAWARTRKKLTQQELASRAGVAPSTIGNVERGACFTMRRILQVAEVLGVNANWLAHGHGEPFDPSAPEPVPLDSSTEKIIELMKTTDEKGKLDILSAAQDVWEIREAHLRKIGRSIVRNEAQRERFKELESESVKNFNEMYQHKNGEN